MSSLNLKAISRVIEQYMLDEITVRRVLSRVTDPDTLEIIKNTEDIYVGKAFLNPEGTPYARTLAGEQLTEVRYEIGIPIVSPVILPNDEVTCDISVFDPELAGQMFMVLGPVKGTFVTHRRFIATNMQDAS